MTLVETHPNDADFKAALARAFDSAWEPFVAMEGQDADTDENRRRLAAKIVQLAKYGETDEDTLAQIGLIHLRVLAAGARLGARSRADATILQADDREIATRAVATEVSPDLVPQWGEHGVYAFGPETVEAMSTALDRCLDQLPLHTPSDARKLLSTSILDDASRGERDPAMLQLHALDALKARR